MSSSPPHRRSGARYAVALAALLGLTGLSFGMHHLALGSAGPAVAFAIATVKVLIVASVFMELGEASPATRLVALFGVLFLALLCLGIAADVGLR